jgi:hypothetical protein
MEKPEILAKYKVSLGNKHFRDMYHPEVVWLGQNYKYKVIALPLFCFTQGYFW